MSIYMETDGDSREPLICIRLKHWVLDENKCFDVANMCWLLNEPHGIVLHSSDYFLVNPLVALVDALGSIKCTELKKHGGL